MKNLIIIALLIIGIIPLSGQNALRVVSSASIFQDMADEIAGGLVETSTIVPLGGDPHVYEPTPSDAVLVSKADLILVNGLTFEGWITELIENSGTKGKVVLITEGITPISSQRYKNAYDPHAWMDARNGEIYATNIARGLIDLDPDNKAIYEANLKVYLQKLRELDKYIFESIKKIPEEHRILITSHDAFAYYGKRYGIKLSAIMGISTDAEAQTSDIVRVSKTIKESGISAIFIESTINPKLLKQLAQDNNVKIGGELFSDSIGDENTDAHGYLEMLKHNTDVITRALADNDFSATKIDEDDTSYNLVLYGFLGLLMVGSLIFLIIKIK
jgi:ABC-type Zn uptake system ZnuABC Zn-binding protein ZnuA